MSKWIPDRKVWAGGVFAVLAWLAILALNSYAGTEIPLDAGAVLAIGLGKAFEYLLPPSALDVIKRINNDLVAVAAASPESPVTKEVGQVAAKAAVGDAKFKEIMGAMGA